MRNVASYRMRRVNEAIKEIIGDGPRPGSEGPAHRVRHPHRRRDRADLSHAKVFVSVYGKQAEKDATLEGLRAARPYLQRLISDELDLKRTPDLEFVYDASIDQGHADPGPPQVERSSRPAGLKRAATCEADGPHPDRT